MEQIKLFDEGEGPDDRAPRGSSATEKVHRGVQVTQRRKKVSDATAGADAEQLAWDLPSGQQGA